VPCGGEVEGGCCAQEEGGDGETDHGVCLYCCLLMRTVNVQ
jgi:hypothetical protein